VVDGYCDRWINGIDDATTLAHRIHALIREQKYDEAHGLLPTEKPYPLPGDLAARIGASRRESAESLESLPTSRSAVDPDAPGRA
jgi:hypothetical protein